MYFKPAGNGPGSQGTGMGIAVFFFFYNMAAGLLIPYLPQYFKSLGYSGVQLATVQSLSYVALIFIPPIWGMISDHTQRPAALLRLACATATLAFMPMLWVTSYVPIFIVMAIYALTLSPVTTLADTVAVIEAKRLGTEYGRLRMWGTIGYIISVWSFSYWLSHGGKIVQVLPLGFALILAYLLVSFFNPSTKVDLHRKPPSFADARGLLARPEFLAFLLAELIHWMCLAPFYVFFTIHLNDLGVGSYVGIAIASGACTEVFMMWNFGALRRRVPILMLLALCSLISSFRWFCNSYLDQGVAIAVVNALHCFTFAACYVGSIVHIERTVPPQLLATGRALFSAVVLGLGGVMGSLMAGMLYDRGHGKLAFLGAGILELCTPLLLLLSWRLSLREGSGARTEPECERVGVV